jgi:hypothetical protein
MQSGIQDAHSHTVTQEKVKVQRKEVLASMTQAWHFSVMPCCTSAMTTKSGKLKTTADWVIMAIATELD